MQLIDVKRPAALEVRKKLRDLRGEIDGEIAALMVEREPVNEALKHFGMGSDPDPRVRARKDIPPGKRTPAGNAARASSGKSGKNSAGYGVKQCGARGCTWKGKVHGRTKTCPKCGAKKLRKAAG